MADINAESMTLPRTRKAVTAAVWLVFMIALFYGALFLYVCLSRIRYPFDLEWLESSMVVGVQRVLAGQKLYVAPSSDFACYQYPPLYYWVSALASLVLGEGYLPLRLVSFVSTIGTFVFIFLMVKRETASAVWGVIGSGIYAAMYGAVSFWFDLARVDPLFLFFLVAALYVVRHPVPSTWRSVLAAVLFLLSYFTKQPAGFVFLGAAAYLILADWRRGILMTALFGIGAVAGTLWLDRVYQGWYTFYTMKLLSQHKIVKTVWLSFWIDDMLWAAPVLFSAAVAYSFRALTSLDRRRLFFPFIFAGALVASWLSRLHDGGNLNVLMPAYAVLAMIFPLMAHGVAAWLQRLKGWRASGLAFACCAAVVFQFAWLFYDPVLQIPTKADEAAGRRLVSYLKSIPGEVFVPSANYYASMAGKKVYAHCMPVVDIMRGTDQPLKQQLTDDFAWAFASRKYAVLILPYSAFGTFILSIARNYEEIPVHFYDNDFEFEPVTRSMRARPERVFVPKETVKH